MAAQREQAIQILLERTGWEVFRSDRGGGWWPHAHHAYLVMLDYLGEALPNRLVICPEDRQRLEWQSDPAAIESRPTSVRPSASAAGHLEVWPYSSTYELVPAATYEDAGAGLRSTLDQHGLEHDRYRFVAKTEPSGHRKLTEVAFPGQKVAMLDPRDRHYAKREQFFAYPSSKVPLLAWDGHVASRSTRETNAGFRPNAAPSPGSTIMTYDPDPWEPPALNGAAREPVMGMYRWTRGGLKGIDFDGQEIDSGNG